MKYLCFAATGKQI